MDRTDVLQIMAVLRGAYPQFYRDISRKEAEDTVNLWQSMFSEDDPMVVGAAVKAIIVSDPREFPPNIGIVKEKMRELTSCKELSEAEAWSLVSKAVRNSIWDAKVEFEKLPTDCQRLVGSPSQLRDWAMMDSDTLHSVVASNFQRSFRVIQKRNREEAKLPSDVKHALGAYLAPMLGEWNEQQTEGR